MSSICAPRLRAGCVNSAANVRRNLLEEHILSMAEPKRKVFCHCMAGTLNKWKLMLMSINVMHKKEHAIPY